MSRKRNLSIDLAPLRAEAERLEGEIAALQRQLGALQKIIEGAAEYQGPSRKRVASKPEPVRRRKRRVTPAADSAGPGRRKRRGWTTAIYDVVRESSDGLSYKDVRAALMNTELADKLRKSDKGFYGAIGKLADAKKLVRHKGHLFTPQAFQRFRQEVDIGMREDIEPPPNAAHHSPLGDAIIKIVGQRIGLTSGAIIQEARKDPELARTIDRNKSHPYNVLSRLVAQGKLVKDGSIYRRVPAESVASNGAMPAPDNLAGQPAATEQVRH